MEQVFIKSVLQHFVIRVILYVCLLEREERICFYKAVLRKGILSSEATVQWCDETIKDLKKS